jgi:hypothetical protein
MNRPFPIRNPRIHSPGKRHIVYPRPKESFDRSSEVKGDELGAEGANTGRGGTGSSIVARFSRLFAGY